GCDGTEETAFAAWQAVTFHQHLAVSGIKRYWLPCRAIVTAEEQNHRWTDTRMLRMHAQCEHLVPSFRAAQLDARRFAHLDRGERLMAIVQRDGGDLLARPFNRLVQIVERLALERDRGAASATAAGSLRARVKAMMRGNDSAMCIEQIDGQRRNGTVAGPRYHTGGLDAI